MHGTVFDIKRGATNDGPGVRTTVFLKGCPLQCLWCHNPESIRREPEVRYIATLCQSCGACVDACPNACHALDEAGRHTFSRDACRQCSRCVEACPAGAMVLAGEAMSTAEVMDIVRKDVRYYEASGGGLTLSGGEPLLQPEFSRELLKAARVEGIHTCFDTTGCGKSDDLRELADHVDLFLYDIKACDAERHRKFTGVDNRLILKNLRELDRLGKQIVLRCPVVPGHNDDAESFQGVAALADELDHVVEINVLPFHAFAAEKCRHIGREYQLGHVSSVSTEMSDAWIFDLQARSRIPVRRG
jgi:pyruvate formate lyase activating enzyme